MPARHLDDLFSAAFEGELTDQERHLFDTHIAQCADCRSAFERFQLSVDAVRALPAARMPIPVHLPSTPPVAEQRPFARWRRPGFLRFHPGLATGLGAAAAAVIVAVALTHQGTTVSTSGAPANRGGGASAPEAAGTNSNCPLAATAGSTTAPAGFSNVQTITDPQRPGQRLLIATSSDRVSPGSQVPIYSVLTVPRPAAAAPGATGVSAASVAVVPCITVTGNGQLTRPAGGAAAAPAFATPLTIQGTPYAADKATGPPLLYFTVPPGTAPGTVLHVTAQVPADYPQPGDPPFSVDLTITVG